MSNEEYAKELLSNYLRKFDYNLQEDIIDVDNPYLSVVMLDILKNVNGDFDVFIDFYYNTDKIAYIVCEFNINDNDIIEFKTVLLIKDKTVEEFKTLEQAICYVLDTLDIYTNDTKNNKSNENRFNS